MATKTTPTPKKAKRSASAQGARRGTTAKKLLRTAKVGARPRRARATRAPLPMVGALLDAPPEPEVVDVPARVAVSIAGAGGPQTEQFQRSLGALYGVAYGLKFSRKPSGRDFAIGPLEGRWDAEGVEAGGGVPPPESWRWRLRLAVPDDVTEEELGAVVRSATTKKGGKLEGSLEAAAVSLERIAPARMGRILHVGPFSEEPASFTRLCAAMQAVGLEGEHGHIEVYLSDPRRTPTARLRTVLLKSTRPTA